MHVVIIGAGEVGGFLAQRLSAEGHDVAIVEFDSQVAAKLSSGLDAHVVVGSGSDPRTLAAAGIERADMLAAVTQIDEVNLISAALAKEVGVPTRIVRLQNDGLRSPEADALRELMGATAVMDPDADTADEIIELLHNTGADEIYPLAAGDLSIVGAHVAHGAELAGLRLSEIAQRFEPNWNFLFGAVTRNGVTSIPRGDQVILAGDHVRVISRRSSRSEILHLLGAAAGEARRIMILGGGAIGGRLAQRLQQEGASIILVERSAERARALAEQLPGVTVVHGDITDTELLVQEDVAHMDAVVAATGEDASNVLACAFARSESKAFTVAVLHRLELLPLVRELGISASISPRTASANAVLRQIRGGYSLTTFLESDVEVDELLVQPHSPVCGRAVADVHLPHDVLLGAVIRPDGASEIVRGSTQLRPNDHVVLFASPDGLARARQAFVTTA